MKRELKVIPLCSAIIATAKIARPIPMKRELKDSTTPTSDGRNYTNRKAHPDEKGTESPVCTGWKFVERDNRKAHPDEKGTERTRNSDFSGMHHGIARPIPMKRELKELMKET